MTPRRHVLAAALAGAGVHAAGPVLAAPALAADAADRDTLRIIWWDKIPNVDPYYTPLRAGLVVAHHAFDCLVYRDPETLQLRPLLAASWRFVDPVTIRFDLRRDVVFHNGDPFTADDVVYTVRTILHDPQVAVPSNYAWLKDAERLDDHAVLVRLDRVFPAALEYAAMVLPIYPAAYRARIGAEGFAGRPVGTGPYRIAAIDGADAILLERNESYYADSPKGRPAIRRLAIREVGDSDTAVAAVLAGEADWTWNFPPENLDAIARLPNLVGVRSETMRVNYLQFDAAGRSAGPPGAAGQPLTEPKVRQAIAHAIDRAAIARQVVQGGARVPDAPCFPTQFGCEAGPALHYDYSPDRARALLAEAGYPNGFATTLVSYLLPDFARLIQANLRAVGIDAQVSQVQVAAAVESASQGRDPIDLGSWASFSINDVSAILPYFFGGGPLDAARDPQVQALVAQGGASTATDERRRAYGEAIRLITERALWLPLSTSVQTYAFSRQLAFRSYFDELPRFFLARWRAA